MITEEPKRLTPTIDTIRALFAVSGNLCAFPGCQHILIDEDNVLVAQVCHIEAAVTGGERFNKLSNNEDRRHISNLMVMCYQHHVKTNDVSKYPTEVMRKMKAEHEDKYCGKPPVFDVDERLADRIFNELQSIKEDTSQILVQVHQQDFKMDQMLGMLGDIKAQNTTSGLQSDFGKEIDLIMEHRLQQKPERALTLLENLQSNSWNKMTPIEHYRLLANMGICQLDLNQDQAAGKLFVDAYQYNLNSINAINFAALGYVITNDNDKARELINTAIGMDPNSPAAYASLLRLEAENGDLDEVIKKIPTMALQDAELAHEIASAYVKQGNHYTAISWAQIALDNATSHKFEFKAALATTILQSVYQPYQVYSGQVNHIIRNKISYVIELFSEAWNELKGTQMQNTRYWILINRAIALKYLGEFEKAYEDVLLASSLHPTFFVLRHLAVAAMETQKSDKAISLIDDLLNVAETENERIDVEVLNLELLNKKGDYESVINGVVKMLKKDLDPRMRLFIVQLYIDTLIINGNMEAAMSQNELLLENDPNEIVPYLNRANYHLTENMVEDARQDLLTAYGCVSDTSDLNDIHQLARKMFSLGFTQEAIVLFERITDIAAFSKITQELLEIYRKSGDYDKLLKACRGLLQVYGPIAQVTELQSFVYEAISDIDKAIETCKDYLAIYPDDQMVVARLIFILQRADRKDEMLPLLERLSHLNASLPMNVQYRLALVLHKAGKFEQAFDVAYETRRQFYDKGQAHQQFVSLSFQMEQESKHPADYLTVVENAAVTVDINESETTFIIENRGETSETRGELNLKDPIAKKLLGHTTGDTITICKDRNARILNIRHKFNHAFTESLELITTRFAHSSGVRKFTVGQTGDLQQDFKELFVGLDNFQEQNDQIEDFYRKGFLSIGAIAEIKKSDPIKVWASKISDQELGVIVTGDGRELMISKKIFFQNVPLLLDLISLMTIDQIDGWDLLGLLQNPIHITRTAFEVIVEMKNDLKKNRETGMLMLGKAKGNYFRNYTTADEVVKYIGRLDKIMAWLEANATILPVTAALQLNAKEKKKMDRILGETFVDAILTAKENQYALFAEETIIRLIALNDYKVYGCNTSMMLIYLKDQGLIDDNRFEDAWLKLIKLNYKFLPANEDLLHKAAVETKFHLVYPLTSALNGLLSDYNIGELCIQQATGFIFKLYREQISFVFISDPIVLRRNIVIRVLDILSLRYKKDYIQSVILNAIKEFYQGQTDQVEIGNILSIYFQVK